MTPLTMKPWTTTTTATTAAKAQAVDVDSVLKNFLASGKHNNDPAKIKAMLERLHKKNKVEEEPVEDEDEGGIDPSDIFSKYKSTSSSNTRSKYSGFSGSSDDDDDDEYYDDEDYDDDYDYGLDDDEDDDGFLKMPTIPPENIRSVSGGIGGGSSSSMYKKFAKVNSGKSFRRPKPEKGDEDGKAKDIFKKYSSKFSPKKKYGGKKYGSKRNEVVTRPPPMMTSEVTATTTSKGTYPPRPTKQRSKYGGGNGKRYGDRDSAPPRSYTRSTTTTPTTTPVPETTTASRTSRRSTTPSTARSSTTTAPLVELDNSQFDTGLFDTSSFELGNDDYEYEEERAPEFDTGLFDLGEDVEFDNGSPYQHTSVPTLPQRFDKPDASSTDSKNSRVPIRNVLDIFQQLKLSFGRKQ